MKNVELYVPALSDFWFRQQCLADSQTMSYNAGYNVEYYGYNYQTGCIDFPKSKWQEFEAKLKNPNFYFAYIVDKDKNCFVGYINYNLNPDTGKATMGVVVKSEFRGQGYMRPVLRLLIEKAKEANAKCLTDTIPTNRVGALKVFTEFGFKVTREYVTQKFNEPEVIVQIEKEL